MTETQKQTLKNDKTFQKLERGHPAGAARFPKGTTYRTAYEPQIWSTVYIINGKKYLPLEHN